MTSRVKPSRSCDRHEGRSGRVARRARDAGWPGGAGSGQGQAARGPAWATGNIG